MSKIVFQQFPNSVIGSLPRTLRAIDIGLILIDAILTGILLIYREERTVDLRLIAGLYLVFLLLSLMNPFQYGLWQRRGYVLLCMSLITSATFLKFDSQLLVYWWIVKSCFLLPRREVILTVVGAGVVYLTGFAWNIPDVLEHLFDLIAQKGARAVFQPHLLLVEQLTFYVGASGLSMILGFLILSERRSRQRTEALSQQVETLAAALERTRIARNIHDSLGHTLIGLSIQLEAVQKLQQQHPDEARRSLTTAQQLVDQCLQDVRRSLSTLRQSDFNLNEAITALVEQSQYRGFSIRLNFRLPQLPLQMSHQIYCIVQEGLINVQKHAHATQVDLTGSSHRDQLVLALKDNGQGFDVTEPRIGFGIRGMEERVQILGGQFRIESTLGQGTEIQITIPLPFSETASAPSS